MKNRLLIGGGIVMLLMGIILVSAIIGVNNSCVTYENVIKAQYGQNQNNYDNFWKAVKESAQVPEMYSNDLKKVYDSAISGRYGKGGSKAVFGWIQEHNPNFDSSLYRQIQQTIEGGRKSFEEDQKTLLDKKRTYETYIGVFPNNVISKAVGFPKIDLTKYNIVTSDETTQAFATKKTEALKLR